jgi:hypothetical protein
MVGIVLQLDKPLSGELSNDALHALTVQAGRPE